jgi:polar amino acid transport system substrate-binding protein
LGGEGSLRKLSIIVTVLLLSVSIMAGCASKSGAKDKVVMVGTDAQYPPFEKMMGNREIVGFDVDIMNAIAKEEGFSVKMVNTGWDPLFEGINRGKVDAGISAITITTDRQKQYDFSDPYFEAKQLILVPTNSTVTSLKDLKGKKIGVQTATTGEAVVQAAFGKTYSGIKGYDDTPAAIDDLKLGRLDAVVADNGVVLEYAKKMGKSKFKVIEDPSFKPEYYGIIVKKGNKELLKKLNDGLKKIKDNGTYDKIFKKYFNAVPSEK